ncbi:hypothetical protein BDV27DRAFT_125193 [Aspergillus caelatus]|uniref:Uncharacterized protein n=1 Tax=Aspergillus caelatus TaxID=61420 RepID=A0A5N7ACY1_9EURO|nr:uncharacterized protein BDV27DRAFT_125193 [Aspergillus caelatus]KAE8366490.1 hypothetical protein BDV27DRAFT_125193 [Aspergillus caelatus]
MVLAKKHVPIVKKRMSKSCLPVFQSSTSTTAQVPCIARVSGKGGIQEVSHEIFR